MQNFLDRLYRLSKHALRTPREDFVSLCVGRHLERDRIFARNLLRTIATTLPREHASGVTAWLDADDATAGTLQVRAQVAAAAPGRGPDGAADLVIGLVAGDLRTTLVIEAKVGDDVPKAAQLNKYAEAFRSQGAVVVALVERRALGRVPPPWPAISWDDVCRALPTSPVRDLLEDLRVELRELLLEAEVGDSRLLLGPGAWSAARNVLGVQERMESRLKQMVVAMFPNQTLRDHVEQLMDDEDCAEEPSEGWGVGFQRGKPIPGSRIRGACLSVTHGDDHDEIVWLLEIMTSNNTLDAWLESDAATRWHKTRGISGWYWTELRRSFGIRALNKADLADVVREGRLALKDVHREAAVSWRVLGEGEAPHAPQKVLIPELRTSIATFLPVASALEQTVRLALSSLHEPSTDERNVLGLRTTLAGRPIRGGVEDGLDAVWIEVEPAHDGGHGAMMRAAADWEDKGVRVVFKSTAKRTKVELPLDGQTWSDPRIVTVLAAVVRAGLFIPSRYDA